MTVLKASGYICPPSNPVKSLDAQCAAVGGYKYYINIKHIKQFNKTISLYNKYDYLYHISAKFNN